MARFVWETREALRRPGGASRGRALKTRDDRKKREFLGARGEAYGRPKARQKPGGAWWVAGVAQERPPQKCVVTLAITISWSYVQHITTVARQSSKGRDEASAGQKRTMHRFLPLWPAAGQDSMVAKDVQSLYIRGRSRKAGLAMMK